MAELLKEPYELVELRDGQSLEFRVSSWELGEMIIHPRYAGAPAEKRIQVLRCHVPAEVKPAFPYYYDWTSKRVIAQLIPVLEAPEFDKKVYKITASGTRPAKWFSVEVRPV